MTAASRATPRATATTCCWQSPRGDRDPRTEDRQLLLDALLAAEEALIITYSGNDERTNAPLPPAVPVGELLDAIDATARVPRRAPPARPAGDPPPAAAVRPAQLRGRVGPDRAAEGRGASTRPRSPAPARSPRPRTSPARSCPSRCRRRPSEDLVTLDELVAFVQRPVRAFLRQRLGISAQRDEDEIDDALPIELDGLERWGVGQRLLDAVLAGIAPRDASLAEIARGTLPPGALGAPVIAKAWPPGKAIAERAGVHGAGSSRRRSSRPTSSSQTVCG